MSIDLSGRTAMQQYYISQRLPAFADKKPEDVPQKKDTKYYKDTVNSWNNPARAGPKTLSYYHNQVEQGKPGIALRIHEERVLREQAEDLRKSYLTQKKNDESDAFHYRIADRLALQAQSKQDIVMSDEAASEKITSIQNAEFASKVTNQQNKVPLLGRAPHLWNSLNMASKKYVDMAINPSIIKSDEKALQLISNRIQKDKEVEELKQKSYEKFHETTRNTFLKQHARNMEFQAKCGLLPSTKPNIIMQSSLVSFDSKKNENLEDRNLQSVLSKRSSLKFGSVSDLDSLAGIKSTSTFQQDKIEGFSTQKYQQLSQDPSKSSLQLPPAAAAAPPHQEQIVIQYTNKAHEQSKQELDRINIGDEAGSLKNRVSIASVPLSLSASTIQKELQSQSSFLIKQSASQMNAQSGLVSIASIKNLMNSGEPGTSDRDYLTSAESHSKKHVNFQKSNVDPAQQQSSSGIVGENEQKQNYSIFELKNAPDISTSVRVPNRIKSAKNRIERLAQPSTKHFEPKDAYDRTEYKGLLSMELGANAASSLFDSNFAKSMKQHNPMINSHLIQSMRPSTRSSLGGSSQLTKLNENTFSFSRPSTTASVQRSTFKIFKNPPDLATSEFMSSRISQSNSLMNNKQTELLRRNSQSSQSIELKNEIFNELDNFEKKYPQPKGNRVGFSQSNLKAFHQKDAFVSMKSIISKQ